MKIDRTSVRVDVPAEIATPTNRLLNDPPFEPASVTEHSTKLLQRK